MKKIISLLLVLMMAFAVVGCTTEPAAATEKPKTTEAPPVATDVPPAVFEGKIALITDVGNIDDKSFNQGTWEGVLAYAAANGLVENTDYIYYRPADDTDADRIECMKNAIAEGATALVCPGYMFEVAIKAIMADYPEVAILFIDGVQQEELEDGSYADIAWPANVYVIAYQEEQAGYFAGYAAVMDGYKKLGFIGGMAVPAVVRYGYGFVQGANDAAKELDIVADVSVNYWYGGAFWETPDIKAHSAAWYAAGTEVIFACGGGLCGSVIASADEAGKDVIGVDVDQYNLFDRIVTSAMKGLTVSTNEALTALFNNAGVWPADMSGKFVKLGAAENSVGLPTAETSWRFANYTVVQYEELFAKVAAGNVAIDDSSDNAVKPTVDIAVTYE